MIRLAVLSVTSLLLLGVKPSPMPREQHSPFSLNANHLFNTIHDSMRQFGSSLHHNGMSYFIASVPSGTFFYHGTYHDKPVQGIEWLSFESEHALMFSCFPLSSSSPAAAEDISRDSYQQVFKKKGGYLHTYKAKHDLRLVYLDGQAAAKSAIGTTDTQDYVLVNRSIGRRNGSTGEFQRAQQMCARAKEQWKGHIDGIMRMEGGFEVIMCSFQDSVEIVRIASACSAPEQAFNNPDIDFNYYQTITARYDGLGGNRVRIDYDDFVSAYTISEANLFRYGSKPRLNGSSAEMLVTLKEQVDRMASQPRFSSSDTLHNWQSVTDMIVARHAPRLAFATSPAMTSIDVLMHELNLMMWPFIDLESRKYESEVQLCTEEYIPPDWPLNLIAGMAIQSVSHYICSTILDLLYVDEGTNNTLASATHTINELKRWLDWTTWKRCSGCKADEVCVVPMWPRGSLSDYEQPSCLDKTANIQHGGYWGPIPR